MDRRQFAVLTTGLVAAPGRLMADPVAPSHEKTWTVGVVGHTGRGNFGHGLDSVWNGLASSRVVAVADADSQGLDKELAKLKLPSSQGFLDYRSMLRETHPEIVAICPRHPDQHHAMILAAIEAGARGIYVEKPFVRTPQEADDVLAACRRHGTRLAVAHRNRYHPVLKTIDRLIAEGRIGRLLEIRGRGKGDRRGGAEDLWVLGSHVLNLIAYFGGRPLSCMAKVLQNGRDVSHKDVREGAEGLGPLAGNELHAMFRFDRGITAYFDSVANDGTSNFGFGLQLIGSKGIIHLHCDSSPLAHLIPGNPFQPAVEERSWIAISSAGPNLPEPISGLHKQIQSHRIPAQDLIDSIESERQPKCNASEGAETVEMICSIFESHRVRGEVTLPLSERIHPLSRL